LYFELSVLELGGKIVGATYRGAIRAILFATLHLFQHQWLFKSCCQDLASVGRNW